MRKESSIVLSCLIIAAILAAALPRLPVTYAAGTTLTLVADATELGPDSAIGQNITIDCVLNNVTMLYGVDIQIKWDTEYLAYVSHTKMIPVEAHSGGIMHSPTIPVKNDIDENATMAGSEPGTTYWLAEASMLPAPVFNGTGLAFQMTLAVKKHPLGMDTNLYVNITGSTLADVGGNPIEHERANAIILLHGRSQPDGPTINVGSPAPYKGTVPYAFDINVTIADLDEYWDMGGFDVQLNYYPGVLTATGIAVDPDGWFAAFWPDGIFVIKNETDNTAGSVWVAAVGIPGPNATHTTPSGSATLFTVSFEATGSGPIEKMDDPYSFAAFPHPERPESPFNNSDSAVPIPYTLINGFANVIGENEYTTEGYTIIAESNSTVTGFYYEAGVPMLLFDVDGPDGLAGYCNVTIPNAFMRSDIIDGWFVLVDGEKITPTLVNDATNTYVYFTYHHSVHHIAVVTTTTIPEYSLVAMMILMLSAIALALTRKFLPGKK